MQESLDDLVLADKRIAERPICLPDNPFVISLKDFGIDEVIASVIDIVATGIAGTLIHGPERMLILPFIGPVLEKGAFLARHAYDAHRIYCTTPEEIRQSRWFYFKQGLKHGSSNLLKDITVHDPMYSGGVAAGLYCLPSVPPFLLSFMSYVVGVITVAGIDVLNGERKFRKLRKQLVRQGFRDETYWESRFLIRADKHPEEVIGLINKEFGLEPRGFATFHDVYMENVLPSFNGRTGKLRLRSRGRRKHEVGQPEWGPDDSSIHTLQVVYSRAKSQSPGRLEQCNYYPIQKTKICYILDTAAFAAEDLSGVPRAVAEQYSAPQPHPRAVEFERSLSTGPELALCVDNVKTGRHCYVLELKARHDIKLLQEAMRYVMVKCPWIAKQPWVADQTTQGKGDLFCSVAQ